MRKLKRLIAHKRMKKEGLIRVNKSGPKVNSYFAEHWREYVGG